MSFLPPIARTAPLILTVPGLGGSGPSHWQTQWEQSRSDTTRVELGMWSKPHRNVWVTKLDQAIRAAKGPVVLVAHSLGCHAVAWWAELSAQPFGWPVTGALLVAPPDVDHADAASEIRPFRPMPLAKLPFPSILVASSDDPWMELNEAQWLARAWGSHFVNSGRLGHINADSGLGSWKQGQALLDHVIDAGLDWEGRPRDPADAQWHLETGVRQYERPAPARSARPALSPQAAFGA